MARISVGRTRTQARPHRNAADDVARGAPEDSPRCATAQTQRLIRFDPYNGKMILNA